MTTGKLEAGLELFINRSLDALVSFSLSLCDTFV